MFYHVLYYNQKMWENINGHNTKQYWNRGYTERLYGLYNVIYLLLRFAKISNKNQNIILSGVSYYIRAQEKEIDDFNNQIEDDYLGPSMINVIINSLIIPFENATRKLLKKGSNIKPLAIPDLYPQAPGKDTTNEINFSKNPYEETNDKQNDESEGSILDTMRNRQSKYKAGGANYDYEYENTGINVKLEKANALDLTKDYAYQSAITQTLKSYVLLLCSNHYYKYYQVRTIIDELTREKNIPLDMKEEEINPSIKRFNNELNFKQTKQALDRYSQGLPPQFIRFFKLDLLDESEEKYIKIFEEGYSQLSEINKMKIGEFRKENGKFYKIKYDYYTEEYPIENTKENNKENNNTTLNKDDKDEETLKAEADAKKQQDAIKQAEKIIKDNKMPTSEGFLNVCKNLFFKEYRGYENIESRIENKDTIKSTLYYSEYNNTGSQVVKKETYATHIKNKDFYWNAIGYEILNEKISVLYRIDYKIETDKGQIQQDIKKMQEMLNKELNNPNDRIENNISKLERYEYI